MALIFTGQGFQSTIKVYILYVVARYLGIFQVTYTKHSLLEKRLETLSQQEV
jgi:hypothetical protein